MTAVYPVHFNIIHMYYIDSLWKLCMQDIFTQFKLFYSGPLWFLEGELGEGSGVYTSTA
jgi:hypothetical protein